MPTAHEVATELRRVADALDLNADVEVKKPHLVFSFWDASEKDLFLTTARVLPRPVEKKYPVDNDRLSRVRVENDSPALMVSASIYREAICRIIRPAQAAEYDCEFTLLDHEDAALTA